MDERFCEAVTPHGVRSLDTRKYFAVVRQTLHDSGRAHVRVTGMSMWPLLRHMRDGVVIVPPVRVRAGDIVLYERGNGRYALHRVIRVRSNRFDMAGDHERFVERDLDTGRVMGVAQQVERGRRRVSCQSFPLRAYALLMTLRGRALMLLRGARPGERG
ncbi:MAG: hypothetical protein E7317_04235 [Clostridiales bacterium]|nr:hypothetical protein [Clostridiales bacterium]